MQHMSGQAGILFGIYVNYYIKSHNGQMLDQIFTKLTPWRGIVLVMGATNERVLCISFVG